MNESFVWVGIALLAARLAPEINPRTDDPFLRQVAAADSKWNGLETMWSIKT